MANRREFIQSSVAAALAAEPALSLLAVGPPLPLYKVVYDQRFAAGREFGQQAQARGASIHAMDGTVHSLWYDDLYHRWKREAVAIAGMTTFNPMFLLAMMAQDARMRLIYRAHHRSAADGAVTHELFGPRSAKAAAAAALRDTHWGRGAAQVVLRWPHDALATSTDLSDIAQANRRTLDAQTLLSWIISPVHRAGSTLV